MRDLDVSSDPQDYIYGPTGNITSRTQGGTNRSGGVSVVEVDEEVGTTQTAAADQLGESTQAPEPGANQAGADATQERQQASESGTR